MTFRISLGFDDENLLLVYDNPRSEEKSVKLGSGGYIDPNDDIYEWLCESNISYQIGYEYMPDGLIDWYFDFDTKEDAMLFKLTWC